MNPDEQATNEDRLTDNVHQTSLTISSELTGVTESPGLTWKAILSKLDPLCGPQFPYFYRSEQTQRKGDPGEGGRGKGASSAQAFMKRRHHLL